MSNSFRHTRDARQSRTDVVVKGIGSEDPGGGLQLVWARYTTHATDYPCRYMPEGWGGAPYSFPEVGTVAVATSVATSIGDRVWGALGSLTWRTDGVAVGGTAITRFVPGDLIELTDPVEGQSATRYVIREVEPVGGSTGHPVWQITVGDVAPDIVDIMRGVTVIQPLQEQIRGAGSGGSSALGPAGVPSQPKDIPPTRAPTHPERNVFQPANPSTSAVITRPGWSDPAAAPPGYVQHQQQAQRWNVVGGYWEAGFWADGDSRPHPYVIDWGYLEENRTYSTRPLYPCAMRYLELEGTGSVTVLKNGSPVAGPYSVSGADLQQAVGIAYARGEKIGITITGTDPSTPIHVALWEGES